jgi:hypothetical protein
MTEANAESGSFRIGSPNNTFGIVLRGNTGLYLGMDTTFNADTNPDSGSGIVFDYNPTAGEWYHLKSTVAGHKATVTVKITGDLDSDQGIPSTDTYTASYVFDWIPCTW